jgi:hypothetical protein
MRMSPTITALLDWVEKQAAPTLDAHCCIVTAIEGRQLAAAVREELGRALSDNDLWDAYRSVASKGHTASLRAVERRVKAELMGGTDGTR